MTTPSSSTQPQQPGGAHRPTQPVRVSYATSWLYFLMVLCLLVAWYFPIKILATRLLWPPPIEKGQRDAFTFAALAYEGVSGKEGEVSPAQFRDHIATLKANGYMPVTLEDVRNMMHEGEPLPRKAVLITFDHGRRTSYFGAKAHMRRAGWNGVMFLWTKPIDERDPASLLWPYVRGMVRSRAWEIGVQSHNGFMPVQANASGRTGHYMTTPMWMADEGRFEKPDEFIARLRADHEKSLALIERRVGVRPIAYAYPYGDFGQFQSRGTFMRRVNLAQIEQFYDLGFVSGNLAANTRYNDPRRLNRLRVRPDWSGEDLVAYLEKVWPMETPVVEGDAGDLESAWIVDWGGMHMEQDRMSLHATDETTGAKMWLAGSDLSRDFYARVDFRLYAGQLGLYVRASPDEESYVYLGIDSRGEAWLREKQFGRGESGWEDEREDDLSVWLRQKHVSLDRFTLASSHTRMGPRDTHTLELFVRDRLLYALINGQPLFGSHIRMRGDPKPGMFGLSVWDPERGRARVDIASVAMKNQQPSLATWAEQSGYSPHVVQWVHKHSYQLTKLSPPWISFSPVGQVVRESWDKEIFDRLAKIYHLDITPRVRVEEEEWLARLPPTLLAQQASELNLSGIFVNLEHMRNATATRVASWLQQTTAALRDKGVALMVKLPPVLERPAAINSILAIAPTLQIATAADSSLNASPENARLSSVQVERVPEPDSDADLPIYYEIMALPDLEEGDQSLQTRATSLEQTGLAAYMDNEFDTAIEQWTEWHELEPGNPRPLMLIGDAHLRANRPAQAISFYDRSLDLDPGQVSLALRRVRIMIREGMEEEALASLNLYARLFPDNPDVLLAQAQYLMEKRRYEEARLLATRVMERDPHNMEAVTMMIRMAETAGERMTYLNRMVQDGKHPDAHEELGNTIWRYDLLSLPEAHELRLMVDQIHRETTDERVRLLYDKLRLRENYISERFDSDTFSEAWWINGGDAIVEEGTARLRADDARTEVSARLLGSERLRDGFVEAQLEDIGGAFWLYARRTENQMIRYGFEQRGRFHLQLWKDGAMVAHESKTIVPLEDDSITLRLELRGSGMMGYVNGSPLFDAAVPIPYDFWYGWYGLAAFDAQRGSAYATLSKLEAGSLPVRAALLPSDPASQDIDAMLDGLRAHVGHLTDMSPRWFTIRPDGEWVTHTGEEERLLRLFTRYHRLRLMPVVEVLSSPDDPVRDVVAQARQHSVNGFVLLFNELPPERWFEEMRKQIDLNPVDILVMALDKENGVVQCRPMGASVDLFHGTGNTWPMRLMSGSVQDEEFNQRVGDVPRREAVVLEL